MDFQLDAQQERIRQTAKRVAREVVASRAASVDVDAVYPFNYFEAFRAVGLLGLTVLIHSAKGENLYSFSSKPTKFTVSAKEK